MAWRNCAASLTLVAAVNAKWSGRDKGSDGTIGDAAHAARTSDHNPWVIVDGVGVVRARDIDVDGVDMAWLMEQLRLLGAAGDPRLAGGGYLIFNRRITRSDWSGWAVYKGSNPHDKHGHVSFSRNPAGFDSPAPWPFLGGPAVVSPQVGAAPGTLATLRHGMRNDPRVAAMQRFLNAHPWRPALPLLPTTGNYLEQTVAVVAAAQRQVGVTGPDADGRRVGPRTSAAFAARGARW